MLVLASASPRRRDLLTELGVQFRIEAAGVDETPAASCASRTALAGDDPVSTTARPDDAVEIAVDLARRKARVVARRRPDDIVLGADTLVVTAAGEILGKPRDADDARRMLAALSGSVQRVITGLCLIVDAREHSEAVTTRVRMRRLGKDEIDAYIASGEPFGKAGAYAIQETGHRFVTDVDGSYTNVVGLPIERVSVLLADAGVPVPGAA